MGRPERHDADYFPFYVKDGKTLYILESKYGLQGIGFFTNLMRFLTRQTDHHICIQDESDRLYFFAQIRCPEDVGMDMIGLMVKTGKLDAKLWAESRVIVSQDLLDSLRDAYKNRNNPIIEIDQIRVSYHKNEVTYPNIPLTSPDKPQRKLKETKLKETKTYSEDFLVFYNAYPNKKDKQDAFKAWQKRNGTRPPIESLLNAIALQIKWREDAEPGEFRPVWKNPATWLNKGSWEGEFESEKQESSIDAWARRKQAEMEAESGVI